MIIRNVIRCNIYGDEIAFKHRHDCLRCCSKEEGCNTDISVIDHSRKKNNVSIDRESTVRDFAALCFSQ